ncbi:MAG: 16S rRNA (adenine(1518)-N(6)/adenine(1519)-N(6))-dimethyltransferase RsmA [Deltaproteobacteria bacterium]|nr:16S rRNA (adenine(1518)-N(6)/adenine(1519)-N(6))-dimethyltransferase RsmA [Deltaproteobacteria bacterium]
MFSISPKSLLQRLNLRPKKTLGQNFLVHVHQARRIVAALELSGDDTVVEIGAGLGALTVFLAQEARRVVAVERDPALARFLQEELFAKATQVEVHCQDVLRFDFLEFSRQVGRPLAVTGNLPYQITSPLLFKLMAERQAVSRAVLMMQQEVGARLLAKAGTKDYGILSVLLRYHFAVQRLFSLGPANFYPPPQVDSVVVKLTPAAPSPAALDPDLLARVVKAAFGQRRKTLNNALIAQAAHFGLSSEQLRACFGELGIDPGRRGETLDLAEFVALSNKITETSRQEAKGPRRRTF